MGDGPPDIAGHDVALGSHPTGGGVGGQDRLGGGVVHVSGHGTHGSIAC